MLHEFVTIFFIDKSREIEPPGMLPYRFLVCAERLHDFLERDFLALGDKKQYLNTVMIRHSLKMPLHLFGRLEFSHIPIIHHIGTNIILTFLSL